MKLLERLKRTCERENRLLRIEGISTTTALVLVAVAIVLVIRKVEGSIPSICLCVALGIAIAIIGWASFRKKSIAEVDEKDLKPFMDIIDSVIGSYSLDSFTDIISELTLRDIVRFRYTFDREDFLGELRELLIDSAENENFKGIKRESSESELRLGIAAVFMVALMEFQIFEAAYGIDESTEDFVNLAVYEKILERFFKGEERSFVASCTKSLDVAFLQLEGIQEKIDYLYLCFTSADKARKKAKE